MAGGKFGGGTGTAVDPYLIEDADDLNEVRRNLTASFKLVNNINMGVPPYNTGSGWYPIQGNYTGNFDGNGKWIMNMYINSSTLIDSGLFAMFGGTLKDIGFLKCNITSTNTAGCRAGIIAARLTNNVNNIYRVVVKNSSVTLTPNSAVNAAGGFFGVVSGDTTTGSFAGGSFGNVGTTTNWSCQATISSYNGSSGGFIGYTYCTGTGTLSNSLIACSINGVGGSKGDVQGNWGSSNLAAATTVYYDSTLTPAAGLNYPISTAKTTAQLKDTATFTAWQTLLVTGASNSSVNNTNVWLLKTGVYPLMYFEVYNKIFVLTNGTDYQVWDGTAWVVKHSNVQPTREQFIANGMIAIDTIPYSAWELLKSYTTVEVVNLIDKTTGATTSTSSVSLTSSSSTTNKTVYASTISFSNYGDAISQIVAN